MLQGHGYLLSSDGGLPVIIEIIAEVPASMTLMASETGGSDLQTVDDEDADGIIARWPRQTLSPAFNRVKFAVDEFLDAMSTSISCIQSLVACLSNFAAQKVDINVSLTSVEMLWKERMAVGLKLHKMTRLSPFPPS